MPLSMDRYGAFVTNNPIKVIVASLLVAVIAMLGAQNLRLTNDYRYFFTKENPYLTAFQELERTYSSPDTLLFVYQPKNGSKAVSREALNLAYDLTEGGWQIPYSTRVDSITNFQNTRAIGEDDLEVRSLLDDPATLDDAQMQYIEQTIVN